jgi:hypothetical protein
VEPRPVVIEWDRLLHPVPLSFIRPSGTLLPPGAPLILWLHLHDLTPEGILHISIFVMLCEAFIEIKPISHCGGVYSRWSARRPMVSPHIQHISACPSPSHPIQFHKIANVHQNDRTAPQLSIFGKKKLPQLSFFGRFSIFGKKNPQLSFFGKLQSYTLNIYV